MTRVLMLRRGGLGDTLLMLPVLAALRAARPDAELHFAGVREFADVLAAFGVVDRALSSEDLQLWALRSGGDAAASARGRLGGYQHIVADDPAVTSAAVAGVQVQVFDPRPAHGDLPLARQLLDQLGLAGDGKAKLLASRPRLPAMTTVVLAPGSGSRHKCWPRACWLALAAQLEGTGVPLAVVVGPTEREGDDPARWQWPVDTVLFADLSASELAQRLRGARALVGNDSGVTHLAAALQVPTVAIFGPTDPTVWAPPGAHVRVVGERSLGPPGASVAAVLAALTRCAP